MIYYLKGWYDAIQILRKAHNLDSPDNDSLSTDSCGTLMIACKILTKKTVALSEMLYITVRPTNKATKKTHKTRNIVKKHGQCLVNSILKHIPWAEGPLQWLAYAWHRAQTTRPKWRKQTNDRHQQTTTYAALQQRLMCNTSTSMHLEGPWPQRMTCSRRAEIWQRPTRPQTLKEHTTVQGYACGASVTAVLRAHSTNTHRVRL